jgi:predicted small lipoprotein YifL
MTQCLLAFCGLLTLLATLGCGNKGPLYLPEKAPEPAPTTETEKED